MNKTLENAKGTDKQITMLHTKAGKGFKCVHNGTWYYTSKQEVFKMIQNKTLACKFRPIENTQGGDSNAL
ncbi:MAG: hypothetical protein ABIB47_01295 [Candidatus Woesearchaeota archaeon]